MVEKKTTLKKEYGTEYIVDHWEEVVICAVCGESMRFMRMSGDTFKYGYQCRCGYRMPIPIPQKYTHLQHESIDEKEARILRKQFERITANIPRISGGKPSQRLKPWQ